MKKFILLIAICFCQDVFAVDFLQGHIDIDYFATWDNPIREIQNHFNDERLPPMRKNTGVFILNQNRHREFMRNDFILEINGKRVRNEDTFIIALNSINQLGPNTAKVMRVDREGPFSKGAYHKKPQWKTITVEFLCSEQLQEQAFANAFRADQRQAEENAIRKQLMDQINKELVRTGGPPMPKDDPLFRFYADNLAKIARFMFTASIPELKKFLNDLKQKPDFPLDNIK